MTKIDLPENLVCNITHAKLFLNFGLIGRADDYLLLKGDPWKVKRSRPARHEVARTDKGGINSNHYCKQLSSYGFYL